MGWGMATMEYDEVRGTFYRAGGWEGRQCYERNGQRRSAPLMAFKPSVWGGEEGAMPSSEGRGGGRAALDSMQRRRQEGMGARRHAGRGAGSGASSLREGGRGAGRRRHAGRVGR
jgi:hypothetical protein